MVVRSSRVTLIPRPLLPQSEGEQEGYTIFQSLAMRERDYGVRILNPNRDSPDTQVGLYSK